MTISTTLQKITAEQKFMLSALLVNAGNYLYNLVLGRALGPEQFGDAAILITFLLVLSFVAMTFQLTTTKFSVLFEHQTLENFKQFMYRYGGISGILAGLLVILFAPQLQRLFHTQSSSMFVGFGIGVPIYFLMSIKRGIYQGSKQFDQLASTYQREMISRLCITLAFIFLVDIPSSISIAIGISCSFFIGMGRFSFRSSTIVKKPSLQQHHSKQIQKFFLLTAFYELTQITINNSDVLMVKHYFDAHQAGLYASLALIGRVVYFVAWMFVMLLLPKVVQMQKEGKNTAPILYKHVLYISLLAISIVLGCYVFPEFVIELLFGSGYMSIAPLLWEYAIATSLFAIANIFAYYFLSLGNYIPVLLSGILGMSQIALIVFFHNNLSEVIYVQIVAMLVLLLVQLVYFFGVGKSKAGNFEQ